MPALALAQAFRDAGEGIEPFLVGAARGIEAQVLPRYPFRHQLLPIEPIYRRAWWKNLRWMLLVGRVWRAVGRVLDDERPAIVVGTGGYAAGPVLWRAQRAGLPTVLVEENAFPGVAPRGARRAAGPPAAGGAPPRSGVGGAPRARPPRRWGSRKPPPGAYPRGAPRGAGPPAWSVPG